MTESSLVVHRDEDRGPHSRWRSAARLFVLLPILVAVVRAVLEGWFPVGDNALLAIRAYDVGTRHHPLLGSWTSASLALGVDVNNPGPLYYDLAAPFMWTFGRAFGIGPATAIAIGSINAAAALGTVLVGARMGGWRAERWMLLLVAALTWSMGSELLFDIWQPHALLLPFCLVLALTIAVAAGDLVMLPVWVGVASLIVQTHVAYVYVVGALVLVVLSALLLRWRAAGAGAMWRDLARRAATSRAAVVSAVVLGLAWIQPVWEQLFGRGEGNLQRLATHAGGGDLTVGAGTALKIVAAVTALPPWWTRNGFADSVPSTPLTETADGARLYIPGLPSAAATVLGLVVVFGALAVLVVVLRHPAQRVARLAAVVSLAAMTVAVAGLTLQTVTETGFGSHQARWLFALAVFVHVTIAWGVVEWAAPRWPASPVTERWLDAGVGVAVVALTIGNLPFHAHDLGPTADRRAALTLERTFDDLERFDPGGPVVYDIDNLRPYEPYSAAVMMRLRELGVEFRFDHEPTLRHFGDARRVDGTERAHLRQYERDRALTYDGDGCVVSLRSGVSADDERLADTSIAEAVADLVSGELAIDVSAMPDDLVRLVRSATAGDGDAALTVVVTSVLPTLVGEGRLTPTPAILAALEAHPTILQRVNSTLLLVATPASAC